jgi:hypothetical protein
MVHKCAILVKKWHVPFSFPRIHLSRIWTVFGQDCLSSDFWKVRCTVSVLGGVVCVEPDLARVKVGIHILETRSLMCDPSHGGSLMYLHSQCVWRNFVIFVVWGHQTEDAVICFARRISDPFRPRHKTSCILTNQRTGRHVTASWICQSWCVKDFPLLVGPVTGGQRSRFPITNEGRMLTTQSLPACSASDEVSPVLKEVF